MFPAVRFLLKNFGLLFYIVNPKETYFKRPQAVPNFITQVLPVVVLLSLLEITASIWTKKRIWKFNDTITSLSQAIFTESIRTITTGLELSTAICIYNRWRFASLAYNSLWTWFLGFILVDIVHYWIHRASHGINLLWAFHQVHHSSKEYNLSSAYRESVVSAAVGWVFYMPLALILPPSVLLVHRQLSALYQIWIHSALVGHLGIIEWVFNTPRHHKVNHGSNNYCSNKNFGGTLIIWDRMFGTFAAENEAKHHIPCTVNSCSPFSVQFSGFGCLLKRMQNACGLKNMIAVLWKVEKHHSEQKPCDGKEKKLPKQRERKELPLVQKLCIVQQFIFALFGVSLLMDGYKITSRLYLTVVLYEVITCSTLGFIMDKRPFAFFLEALRCCSLLVLDYSFGPMVRITRIPIFFHQYWTVVWDTSLSISAAVWIWSTCVNMRQYI